MKKFLPVGLVLVLLIGAGVYLLIGRGKEVLPESVTSGSSVADTFTGTLKEAVARGVGMKCTYEAGGNEYEGYVKGKNYRGKMKTAEGKSGEVIIKDNCMWTWAVGEAEGMKTCFEEVEDEETDVWEQPQGIIGSDLTYKCVPAAVSGDKFTPPSNVNFMDLESMMENFGY